MDDVNEVYDITFSVEVEDLKALREYARAQREVNWGDSQEWLADKPSVGEILMEALLFSNENPSPDEYGIGFTGEWKAVKRE